jgi:hypothetical protein
MRRRTLLLTALLLIPQRPSNAAPACTVDAQPKIGLAPIRYVRVKVQTQDRAGGELMLVGPSGLETSSLIQAGPVTTWVEWKNVLLGEPGDYEVRFAGPKCTARDRVQVAGGDGH